MKATKTTEKTARDFNDRAAERIAEGILRTQQKIASILNRKVSGLSSRILKFYLLVFCLLFGLACLWIVLTSAYLPS